MEWERFFDRPAVSLGMTTKWIIIEKRHENYRHGDSKYMKLFVILIYLSLMVILSCSESSPTGPEFKNPKNLYITDLRAAVGNIELILDKTSSGNSEGQYPSSERSKLESEKSTAKKYLVDGLPEADQNEVDSLTYAWFSACTDYESSVVSELNDLIDPKATKETRYLYNNLKKYAPDKLLFGMHDATGYGVGWSGNDDRSDVKDVCGSYPAVFSWDVNNIINDPDLSRFEYRMLLAYENGINTLCWHQIDPEGHSFYYDQVNYEVVPTILPGGEYHKKYLQKLRKFAGVMKKLRGPNGESVPVIFRPYHEQNGSWFWWGRTRCTEQDYQALWQFTVTYLRDSLNVHNLIYAFSPDGNQFNAKDEYFKEYPGDSYVDIFGLDFYFWEGTAALITKFQQRLVYTVQNAQSRGKLAALTEVGDELLDIDHWYTRCLDYPVQNNATTKNIAYAAVWRNAHTGHFYAPYPGHSSVPDFLTFYQDPFTVFANDLVNVYVLDSGL
jgi:mannan endo-1,4-beta-mannosidase